MSDRSSYCYDEINHPTGAPAAIHDPVLVGKIESNDEIEHNCAGFRSRRIETFRTLCTLGSLCENIRDILEGY